MYENKFMKFDAIIEARMTSKRMPGKVMLHVLGKPMIEYLVERLNSIKLIDKIILATTRNSQDNILQKTCKNLNILCYRGSENNVLSRVVNAGLKYKVKNAIRITADCPIIDPKIITEVLNKYSKLKNYDCVTNSHIRSYPDGMDVTAYKFKALIKSSELVKSNYHKEHVTSYMFENPSLFKIKHIIANKKLYWPELGLTLDEKNDFVLIKKIIRYFNDKKKYNFNCEDIIKLLKKKKKNWIYINSNVKRKAYDKKQLKKLY